MSSSLSTPSTDLALPSTLIEAIVASHQQLVLSEEVKDAAANDRLNQLLARVQELQQRNGQKTEQLESLRSAKRAQEQSQNEELRSLRNRLTELQNEEAALNLTIQQKKVAATQLEAAYQASLAANVPIKARIAQAEQIRAHTRAYQ